MTEETTYNIQLAYDDVNAIVKMLEGRALAELRCEGKHASKYAKLANIISNQACDQIITQT